MSTENEDLDVRRLVSKNWGESWDCSEDAIYDEKPWTLRFGPFTAMGESGRWWFRVFGYGLAWVDRKRHPWKLLSEREGLRKVWYLSNNQGFEWGIQVLKP